MCGEYGEKNGRPHFHALLFNVWFSDAEHFRGKGERAEFRSAQLERIWGHGGCVLGQVTYESAAYVTRYLIQDRNRVYVDSDGELRVARREFNQMSRDGGIGSTWWKRFGASDVVPDGQVVIRGRKGRAPRFYDKAMRRLDAHAFSLIVADRVEAAALRHGDQSPERLAAREAVALAALAQKRRE